MSLLGAVLMVLALPPWDLWPLAWLAPIPWLMLVRQPKMLGWRPYRALYLAGFAFWLCVLHWLRLPYWAIGFGWLALAAYSAVYVPLFVGLSRVAVHWWRMPLIVAAPLTWTGLELAKGRILGGFTMGSLAHSQYRWTTVIQLADIAGAYGVGCLVMAVAACLAQMLPSGDRRWSLWPLLPGGAILGLALLYGNARLKEALPGSSDKASDVKQATVALIQGSIDTTVNEGPESAREIFDQYNRLTHDALRSAHKQRRQIDLIVWPETMFRFSLVEFDESFQRPDSMKNTPAEVAATYRQPLEQTAENYGHALLFGVDRHHVFSEDHTDHFNSAVFVDPTGKFLGTYDKQQRVMFGEYIPLAEQLPWLYTLTPLAGGIKSGVKPLSVEVAGLRFSPNICYESAVPHHIAGQVRELAAAGREPDVLVNLTNDGWFWGSSELDLHLICGVFRAVECRKPLLIAANTGFSASIDGNGRIVDQGKRRKTDTIIADVRADGRQSWYVHHGDVLPGLCLAFCGIVAAAGVWRRRSDELSSSPLAG